MPPLDRAMIYGHIYQALKNKIGEKKAKVNRIMADNNIGGIVILQC